MNVSNRYIVGLLFLGIILYWFKYQKSEGSVDSVVTRLQSERRPPKLIITALRPSSEDWSPPQNDIDNWKNEAAFIHCPHGSDGRAEGLKQLADLVSANSSSFCSCPKEVTFFLVTNLAEGKYPVSEELYKLCGCNYIHIRLNKTTAWLGMGWSYKYKVTPLLQWLEAHGETLPTNSYVFFSDAFDTGIVGDASNIVQRFLEYDCEMLGISTVADWPPNKELAQFESEKYPWSKCRPHLSSGAWMVRAAYALKYLRIWDADWRQSDGGRAGWERNHGWDDQMAFRRLHNQFYPRFKVDTLARIWTRADKGRNCI